MENFKAVEEHYSKLSKKETEQLEKVNNGIVDMYKKIKKSFSKDTRDQHKKALVMTAKIYAQAVMNDYKNRMVTDEKDGKE